MGIYVFPTTAWLDPVGAIAISFMVVQAGVESTKGAIAEFLPQKSDKQN